MKKIALAMAATFALGTPAMADPIEGIWQTEVDDGAFAYVTLAPCGADICGTISRTFNAEGEYQSENIGKQIVRNMTPQGDGSYDGQVWRPSNDKVYNGDMTMNGDQLALRGCVAGGLICASQTWVRIQ